MSVESGWRLGWAGLRWAEEEEGVRGKEGGGLCGDAASESEGEYTTVEVANWHAGVRAPWAMQSGEGREGGIE